LARNPWRLAVDNAEIWPFSCKIGRKIGKIFNPSAAPGSTILIENRLQAAFLFTIQTTFLTRVVKKVLLNHLTFFQIFIYCALYTKMVIVSGR